MAEFISSGKNDVGESIIFENKTNSSFEVSAGIVFHKSGLYEVSIIGNKTIVSKAMQRKKGEWIQKPNIYGVAYCSECDYELLTNDTNFCPNCGAMMIGERNE